MKINRNNLLTALSCFLLIAEITGCAVSHDNLSLLEKQTSLQSEVNIMQSTVTAKLEISPSIEKTSDGIKVRIKTVLTNSGASPLWVNKRMLFNTAYAPRPFREIWFDVKAPNGDKLEFNCKVKAGAAREEHYAILKPGESVERDIRLSNCFDMAEKGEYEIKAHYQDGNKEVPPAPENAAHLKDELESQTIKISIN